MPLFTTPAQFVALILVLVAGWFLGLASRSGGRKWRNRYAAERDAHATTRRSTEERHAASQARVAELERENRELARGAPVRATSAARPATRSSRVPGDQRGWFDWPARSTRG